MMANRRSTVSQSDITKVLRAFRAEGQPMPQIVIELDRMTVSPMFETAGKAEPNPWDQP